MKSTNPSTTINYKSSEKVTHISKGLWDYKHLSKTSLICFFRCKTTEHTEAVLFSETGHRRQRLNVFHSPKLIVCKWFGSDDLINQYVGPDSQSAF